LAAHQGYLEAVKNEVFPITPADLYLMTLCIVLAILCLDKEKP
jgi:hypothetical protein